MKTLKCDMCDHEESAETFEEWMNKLKPHWGSAHAEDMKKHMNLPPEEQKALMQKWMADNKARFDVA